MNIVASLIKSSKIIKNKELEIVRQKLLESRRDHLKGGGERGGGGVTPL